MSRPAPVALAGLCAAVVVLELLATGLAVALNLPAQFGATGTDAAAEFASRGTAISPPPLPLAVLAAAAGLALRRGAATVAGALAVGVGVLFAIGSLGEATAPATPDVGKAVLVGSGIAGVAIALALVTGGVRAIAKGRRAV